MRWRAWFVHAATEAARRASVDDEVALARADVEASARTMWGGERAAETSARSARPAPRDDIADRLLAPPEDRPPRAMRCERAGETHARTMPIAISGFFRASSWKTNYD